MLILTLMTMAAAGDLPLVEVADSSGAVVLRESLDDGVGEWSVETGPLTLTLEASLAETGGTSVLEGTLTGRTGLRQQDACAFKVVVIEGQHKTLRCPLQDPPLLYLDGVELTRLSYTVELRWTDEQVWLGAPETASLEPVTPGGGLALSTEAPAGAAVAPVVQENAPPTQLRGRRLLVTGNSLTAIGAGGMAVGLTTAWSMDTWGSTFSLGAWTFILFGPPMLVGPPVAALGGLRTARSLDPSHASHDRARRLARLGMTSVGLGYLSGVAGISLESSTLGALNSPLVVTGLILSNAAYHQADQVQGASVSLSVIPTPDGFAMTGRF